MNIKEVVKVNFCLSNVQVYVYTIIRQLTVCGIMMQLNEKDFIT